MYLLLAQLTLVFGFDEVSVWNHTDKSTCWNHLWSNYINWFFKEWKNTWDFL